MSRELSGSQKTTSMCGFYFDGTRCTGCKTCEVACIDYHGLAHGVSLRHVYEYTGGAWMWDGASWRQDVFSYNLSIACNHCDDPACVRVCPSAAMHSTPDGLVVGDETRCIGCGYCALACPYNAPALDREAGVMRKCDGCRERLDAEPSAKPICVEACPSRALDFGPIEELRERYGDVCEVAPLPERRFTKPNLVIRPHHSARPSNDSAGCLANPREVYRCRKA